MRKFLQTLSQERAVLISYLLIPVNTWLVSLVSLYLLHPAEVTLGMLLFSEEVLRNVAVAAIIGGLVIRYFYLQAMLIARRQSELLHRKALDFLAKAPSLIAYVNRYRSARIPEDFEVRFIPYDWRLNRQPGQAAAKP